MQLDDLDRRILEHFARFPKPTTLEYCEYDVDASEVQRLCSDPALYLQGDLLRRFASHNRWAMFGDWRQFPAFAGDLAVHCRRTGLLLKFDLAFFFLHSSPPGAFDASDRSVLKAWVHDALCPWEHAIERQAGFSTLFAIDYLVLYATLGGSLGPVLQANVERETLLVSALLERCPGGRVDEQAIRTHLEQLERSADNQTLPVQRYVDPAAIEATVTGLEGMLAQLGDPDH